MKFKLNDKITNNITIKLLTFLIFITINFISCKQTTEPGVGRFRYGSELSDEVRLAYDEFQKIVGSTMKDIAKAAGIKIMFSGSDEPVAGIEVFIKKQKLKSLLVNCPIQGSDTLSLEQLERGAEVLFLFLLLPDNSELSSGFYVVKFFKDLKGQWIAQFQDMNRRIVLEKPAIVESSNTPHKTVIAGVSLEEKERPAYVCQVGHFSPIHMSTTFQIGDGDITTVTQPAASQLIQAVEEYRIKISNALNEASGIYNKSISSDWISNGMSKDKFTVYTVFEDAINYTNDDLSKGKDLFIGYFPSITLNGISILNDGFYKVCFRKESGLWKACFYEKEHRSDTEKLIIKLEERVIIESMPAETKIGYGRLTGGVIFNEKGPAFKYDFHWDEPGTVKTVSNKGAFIINPKMDSG